MKSLFEIVDFYEKIKQKDLFPESIYKDEISVDIEKYIKVKNQEFFDLIEKLSSYKDFGYKSLQIAFNKLESIYWEIDGDLKNNHFPKIANIPLFRFKIEYKSSSLTIAFSKIEIIKGISEIYFYLENHFSDVIIFKERIMQSNYCPEYIDEEGYLRHIYFKLIARDCLKTEFYNNKKYQVKKIDEFLRYLPSAIEISLPVDYKKNRWKDESIKSDELNSSSELIEQLEKELDSIGANFDESKHLKDIFQDQDNESVILSGYEIIFPFKIPVDHFDGANFNSIQGIDKTLSIFKEVKYSIDINCHVDKKEKAFDYLIDLFNSLKKIGLVSTETNDEDIISVFSGESTKSKIIWSGYKNSITYFIRQTEHVYGIFKIPSPKWDVVCFYFKNKEIGSDFDPKRLETNGPYKKSAEMDPHIKEYVQKLKSL